ncbi:MAG: hypothetical protein KUG76_01020 [Gammaproteobacteria bacterium]|nr:hypothetical protein [Gammaproteobacteria bacterium]
MTLYPLQEFPAFSLDQSFDYSFIYNVNHDHIHASHYLAYECHRDFVSVPKTWAVLKFQSHMPGSVNLNAFEDYGCLEYDNEGVCQQLGFFLLENSTEVNDQDSLHFIMSTRREALEVICGSVSLEKVIYQCANAQSALVEFLSER